MTEADSTNSSPDAIAPATGEAQADPAVKERRPRVFGRFGTMIVVVPFVVYLLGTYCSSYLENLRVGTITGEINDTDHGEEMNRPPKPKIDVDQVEVDPNARFLLGLLPLGKNSFPYTYIVNVGITTALVLLVSWGYFRVPFKIHPISVLVGVVGIVVWVALTELDRRFLGLGDALSSGRPGFNPFEEMKDNPTWLKQFLAIRFWGLVVIVPLIEEFFVRGFLIRYVDDPDWDEQPLGQAKTLGWLSPTIYGVVAHTTEPLAALAWFSLVTWMYKKTGSIWDCVVAHSITNLLLGIIVIKWGLWYLW